MAQTDPEDGFDQIMVQSWNSVAQQLRTLHNELSGDRARRRERAERAVQNERYEQTRRQQQSIRLEQWEMDNRERLNKGFESTLNATVLADGDGWRKMRDSSLLQGWMVADQLEGNDPGYRRQIIEAKARLKDEWSKRHPETHIDAAADQLTGLAAQAPSFKTGVSRLFLIRCVGSVRIVSLWRVALPPRLRRSSCSSTVRGAFFSARGTGNRVSFRFPCRLLVLSV